MLIKETKKRDSIKNSREEKGKKQITQEVKTHCRLALKRIKSARGYVHATAATS